MAAERALVDRPFRIAAERNAGMFKLDHRGGRLAHHIFDRVLVAEPVRALDRVVHVPASVRSEEHTPELLSLMRISYAVFCLNKTTAVNAMLTTPRHYIWSTHLVTPLVINTNSLH